MDSNFPPWCDVVMSLFLVVRNPLGQHTTSSTLFVVGRSSMIFLCFVMFCGPITLSLLRMIQLIMCDIMTSSSFVGQTWIFDCQSLIFFVVKMPLITSAFHSSAPIPPRSFVVDLHTDTKVTRHLRICRSWCNKARLGPVTGPNLAIEKRSTGVSQYQRWLKHSEWLWTGVARRPGTGSSHATNQFCLAQARDISPDHPKSHEDMHLNVQMTRWT